MLLKILRTLIGMPFVLMVWVILCVLCITFLGAELIIRFVFTGKIPRHLDEETFKALTLPYQFIKTVWGKDDDR
jgi:hypothetical protein